MGYMHSVLANQIADIFTPNDNVRNCEQFYGKSGNEQKNVEDACVTGVIGAIMDSFDG